MADRSPFPEVSLPDASWVGYAFGEVGDLQSIVGRAAWSRRPDLRMVRLPEGDETVRVWGGPVLDYLRAVALEKRAGRWSAARLLPCPPTTPRWRLTRTYPAPESGWDALWAHLKALGVWDLPDDSTLPQEGRGIHLDGSAYTVELQRGGAYRAYHYGNPHWERWPEAAQMVSIVELLDAEFPL